MKFSIKGTNIQITEGIKDHVASKIENLDKYYAKIIKARIEVGLITHHHQKGNIFRAEGNIEVPGTLLRSESLHEDLYVAIDELTKKLKRELRRFKEKKIAKARHQVKKI